MTLGELIESLEREPQDKAVFFGFRRPHSYRGYYEDLAFEPVADTTAGEMLEAAKSALGKTFTGYKGGEFTMTNHTDVWLAHYGSCGEGIGPILLAFMLGNISNLAEAMREAGEKLQR